MIKGYFVNIPPHLSEVLARIGQVSEDEDFDVIVNSAYEAFFTFYTPKRISNELAVELEKFVLNYFIMRRVGSGNIRKWKQIFRNKWNSIMPYYERLLETEENEKEYFKNPIANVDVSKDMNWQGTLDSQEDTTKNSDTDFDTQRTLQHSGQFDEHANGVEINRYLDTPQSEVSRIWERDAQGNLNLNDLYLTDIRGITTDSDRSGHDSHTDNTTGHDDTVSEETGQKVLDQDTTHTQKDEKFGYEGVNPSELMEKYRETFLRTFENIVNELEPCFYQLVEVDDLIDFV